MRPNAGFDAVKNSFSSTHAYMGPTFASERQEPWTAHEHGDCSLPKSALERIKPYGSFVRTTDLEFDPVKAGIGSP